MKYLTPSLRELLYLNADYLSHEIALRLGGELGLRTKELKGLLLNDFEANRETKKGLKSLFDELENDNNIEEFEYYLSSLYTKYGTSRIIKISRYLLEKMKLYYENERPTSNSNHLLVSNSTNSTRGKCISSSFGSDVFYKVKNKILKKIKDYPELYKKYQNLEPQHSYHCLRHSAGTDVFYNLCNGANKHYETITTTSSVYIQTALFMGHKVDSIGARDTTKVYIHSCGHREKLIAAECSK